MRIAMVTETFLPSIDGVVTRLTKAISYFRRMGHEVLVIAPDLGVKEYLGAKVIGIKPVYLPFYKSRPWTLPSKQVEIILKTFKPDIVHAVNPLLLAASGVKYARKLNLPLIASFHTNVPMYMDFYHISLFKPLLWSYIRNLHNRARKNLVTSKAMYDELNNQSIQNISILPKGVEVDSFNPRFYDEEVRRTLTNGHIEKTLLVFVGRLAPEKNIDSLLPLMKKRDDLCLAVIGDGPVREKLEKQFKGTNTVFTGFKKGEELAKCYASSDAFVFPSVSETLGLVILEGMASGLPVLAAMSPPINEQIHHGVDGLLYDSKSMDSLESAIEKLKDKNFLTSLRENARKESLKYSWDEASKALLYHYQEVLQERRIKDVAFNL